MTFIDPALMAQGSADQANKRLDVLEARIAAIECHPALSVPALAPNTFICGQCGEDVERGMQMDGCRDPDCPCQ